ncbi:MAG: pyridoxal-phosphate dependent enzyme [Halieaceae bacterium]|jgi:threonine dehydratase|uniref:Pyridoxal-phosphate dependent enzyme n=1 Tax=Candidatus Seongchinamella marina TaxID=2518990 RepID=A0ABT3SUT1_9GAMM|nr:pyridoxal-phosphate dependent enzyme [Candidatus Seongchinamella marina]MBT3411277.1 pyridoxal-phosphate dependent enzyme [Halieaceae bacterium]MBT5006112.1 pyridoxal-phosphate dependent enzyme [Halieaceae bacterium]MBT6126193.1 pyridoxal-phosphate dependent enzyme [Halieaceae bacterium]MBT7718384.1 pyridoxal-phosphate dependent enzyme [Halieaceae bacterium]MCX2973721.1 pyridoxal-phosphate dependent enzyme [Candidatus Seongchinamella marina]
MTERVLPVLEDLQEAWCRISPHLHRTPVMSSHLLDQLTGANVFFKCEHLQKAGAFKARGAINAVLSLDDDAAAAGVATHSSGNHGAALAMAASARNIPAHIVMPSNAPRVKKEAVAAYGGLIIECEPTLAARESTVATVIEQTGAHEVHPYNDSRIIAGQGTAMLELLEQVEDLDVVVVPVGGGGLLAGTAIAVKESNSNIEVVAVEPEGADDAFRSFGLGELQPQNNPQTIADGLRAGLGELNFDIIRKHVDTILTVPDTVIVQAMQLQWTRMKQLVEPSGAVSFAGLLEHPERFRQRRVGVVVSGGNVDLDNLPW